MENKEGFAKLKQLPPTRDFSPVGALPKLEEKESNSWNLWLVLPHGDPFRKVKPESEML